MRIYQFLVTFVILFTFWLLLSSFFDALHLIAGMLCSLLAALISYKLLRPGKNIVTLARFILYIPWLIYQIILANFDVAYRTLHPDMPIDPEIIQFKSFLKSGIALTTLANSITLTPGTLTVDLTDDGYLYIHWINVKSDDIEQATKFIAQRFEWFIQKIFE